MPITIRDATLADAAAIARVHVASWRTTYRGIISADYLAQLSNETHEQHWAAWLREDPERQCTFVAEDGAGQVIGFAYGGATREPATLPGYRGELYAIYLLEDSQRRGLGRTLVRAVAANLASHGLRSLVIWALEGNPACRFYEALGGQHAGEKTVEIGGTPFVEVAFSWPDTSPLL